VNPWEQVGAVLAEAKKEGMPWGEAWDRLMELFSWRPRTGYGPLIRDELATDRDLLRECKPWLQAAYEDREVTVPEWEQASASAEKRLDDLMAPA
jgi:hypothetical protein